MEYLGFGCAKQREHEAFNLTVFPPAGASDPAKATTPLRTPWAMAFGSPSVAPKSALVWRESSPPKTSA